MFEHLGTPLVNKGRRIDPKANPIQRKSNESSPALDVLWTEGLSASEVMQRMGIDPNSFLPSSGELIVPGETEKPTIALRWKLRKKVREQASARALGASSAPNHRDFRSVTCPR
ncbi:MAG: hypothetical protein ACKPKO_09355, partial [Candidatus Fonsibacter sp.]